MQHELNVVRAELRTLQALVHARDPSFDASQAIVDLQRLREAVEARPEARIELRQILILLGMAECVRGKPFEARELLRTGLSMEIATTALIGESPSSLDRGQCARDHYFLASVAGDLKDFETAANHYAKAAALAKEAPAFGISQQLGILEKQAFALHEAKRFNEAYQVNAALLAEGERHFGAEAEELTTVLINAAQNLYALGRLGEAAQCLKRSVSMALSRNDIERSQDLLYQLAVLSGEQGDFQAARGYLQDRVARLLRSGKADLLAGAQRALDNFDRQRQRAV